MKLAYLLAREGVVKTLLSMAFDTKCYLPFMLKTIFLAAGVGNSSIQPADRAPVLLDG